MLAVDTVADVPFYLRPVRTSRLALPFFCGGQEPSISVFGAGVSSAVGGGSPTKRTPLGFSSHRALLPVPVLLFITWFAASLILLLLFRSPPLRRGVLGYPETPSHTLPSQGVACLQPRLPSHPRTRLALRSGWHRYPLPGGVGLTSPRYSLQMFRLLRRCATVAVATIVLPTPQAIRHINMNRSVQSRWEKEAQEANQQRTEYDFDKEKWMKQMKIQTLDCIVDPCIEPLKYTSLKGIKRGMDRFITMKKLRDRRPDFDAAELQKLFVTLKTISHSRNLDQAKRLHLITTHAEADRISKEIRSRMNEDFTKKSWKALRQQQTPSHPPYNIEITTFDLVNCYMGQMTAEDWLQLTYRCEFRERTTDPDAAVDTDVAQAADWTNQLEFPVFEVRLTDGLDQQQSRLPFKVVGVLKKDGTRYGKDVQDATSLKKQFDRSKKWF
eukprot:gene292-165_t